MEYKINQMKDQDWPEVQKIYQQGIETRDATFDAKVPEREEWDEKYHSSCRLVARDGDDILGWAALIPLLKKEAFSGVGEVSIYIALEYRGEGIGQRLLEKLIEVSEKEGFWTLEAWIFPSNQASLALHKKLGFREVGMRKKIGRMKNGQWRDVMVLERRSKKVGV